mgnify:CR=1 FL=1
MKKTIKKIYINLKKSFSEFKELNQSKANGLKKSRKNFLYPSLWIWLFWVVVILVESIIGKIKLFHDILFWVGVASIQAAVLMGFVHFIRSFLFWFRWLLFLFKKTSNFTNFNP